MSDYPNMNICLVLLSIKNCLEITVVTAKNQKVYVFVTWLPGLLLGVSGH